MQHYFKTKPFRPWRVICSIGTILFVILVLSGLCMAAGRVRTAPVDTTVTATAGPLALASIHKTAATEGGYMLNFTLQRQLFVVLILCYGTVGLGVLLVTIRHHRRSPPGAYSP